MTTLENTLHDIHDWASALIVLHNELGHIQDSIAIGEESYEWLDPEVEDVEVVSLDYIGEEYGN